LSPYRLHRKFEKTGERWDSDWSWFVRNDKDEIVIDPQSNPDSLYEQLHRTFKAHKIYPDFSRQLADAARAAMGSKEPERGSKFARNSARLYPNSDYALTFLGVLHFVGGDADSGRVYLTEAAEINPAGEASDMGLNAYAYQLAGIGLVDAAINILKVATDLHPKVANLYDSMGEMYLMKSDTLQAVAYYEKALRVDPNFTNARQMIRRIRADAE
jgi:tetratricopeptide (TPR) repeat protein